MARNIRNAQSFVNSWWNWAVYNECFGATGIRISDVDGVVERNGWFLWIETKHSGEAIPMGQRILFDHVTLMDEFNVLIIWGETDKPETAMLWRWQNRIYQADEAFIKRLLVLWFENANANPRIKHGRKPSRAVQP